MYEILFIGAHPDDVEMGCGGTIAKCSKAGYNTKIVILTDDVDEDATRRQEALSAAKELGVKVENIVFFGTKDGSLKADRLSVGKLRKILAEKNIDPDLVFIHSQFDSHNDHRAAHELCLATFREKCLLTYTIPNSLIENDSVDHLWIDITKFKDVKIRALGKHQSQASAGRILYDAIERSTKTDSDKLTGKFYEKYSIIEQKGADPSIVTQLNDNPLSAFWYDLIQQSKIYNIEGQSSKDNRAYQRRLEVPRKGLAEMLENLQSGFGFSPNIIDGYSCRSYEAPSLMEDEHVIISGGSVSNTISRDYFDHFSDIKFKIDYEMPGYKNINILNIHNGQRLFSEYGRSHSGMKTVEIDYGILSILRNPCSRKEKLVIGCMGINIYGTQACFRFLSDEKLVRFLKEKSPSLLSDNKGVQIILKYTPSNHEINIHDYHLIH